MKVYRYEVRVEFIFFGRDISNELVANAFCGTSLDSALELEDYYKTIFKGFDDSKKKVNISIIKTEQETIKLKYDKNLFLGDWFVTEH